MIRTLLLPGLCSAVLLVGAAAVAADPPSRAQQLRAEMETLRAKAAALREMGQPEQAARLIAEADRLLTQIEGASSPAAPTPLPAAPRPRRDRLSGPRGRIEELRQQADRLAAAGRGDEAGRLLAEAEAIAARYAQQWQIEMAVMQEQVARLRAENEERAAKKIEEEIAARNEELRRLDQARAVGPRPAGAPPPAAPGERVLLQRRIEELTKAQAHLQAANQSELAEQVGREIAQLQRRLAPLAVAGADELTALRAEVEALRRELAALKASLERQGPTPALPK